jgi:hypothetical protein
MMSLYPMEVLKRMNCTDDLVIFFASLCDHQKISHFHTTEIRTGFIIFCPCPVLSSCQGHKLGQVSLFSVLVLYCPQIQDRTGGQGQDRYCRPLVTIVLNFYLFYSNVSQFSRLILWNRTFKSSQSIQIQHFGNCRNSVGFVL